MTFLVLDGAGRPRRVGDSPNGATPERGSASGVFLGVVLSADQAVVPSRRQTKPTDIAVAGSLGMSVTSNRVLGSWTVQRIAARDEASRELNRMATKSAAQLGGAKDDSEAMTSGPRR